MSDAPPIGFPEAAHRLGVPVRVLRRAIRAGKIAAPPRLTALAPLSAEWLQTAQATAAASPKTFSRESSQKVPPFARFRGTSAWRKYTIRAREYAHYRVTAAQLTRG